MSQQEADDLRQQHRVVTRSRGLCCRSQSGRLRCRHLHTHDHRVHPRAAPIRLLRREHSGRRRCTCPSSTTPTTAILHLAVPPARTSPRHEFPSAPAVPASIGQPRPAVWARRRIGRSGKRRHECPRRRHRRRQHHRRRHCSPPPSSGVPSRSLRLSRVRWALSSRCTRAHSMPIRSTAPSLGSLMQARCLCSASSHSRTCRRSWPTSAASCARPHRRRRGQMRLRSEQRRWRRAHWRRGTRTCMLRGAVAPHAV